MVVQHKVNAKGGDIFGAALLRPRAGASLAPRTIKGAAIHRGLPRCTR